MTLAAVPTYLEEKNDTQLKRLAKINRTKIHTVIGESRIGLQAVLQAIGVMNRKIATLEQALKTATTPTTDAAPSTPSGHNPALPSTPSTSAVTPAHTSTPSTSAIDPSQPSTSSETTIIPAHHSSPSETTIIPPHPSSPPEATIEDFVDDDQLSQMEMLEEESGDGNEKT